MTLKRPFTVCAASPTGGPGARRGRHPTAAGVAPSVGDGAADGERTLFYRATNVPSMKLLLGVGGTDDSIEAVRKTVARADRTGHDLTIAIVDDPASERDPDRVEALIREILTDADRTATVRHVEGDPGPRLVELAEVEDFDEIALGGGKKSPMGKIRIGTMQEFVLLNAHTTVSLVR